MTPREETYSDVKRRFEAMFGPSPDRPTKIDDVRGTKDLVDFCDENPEHPACGGVHEHGRRSDPVGRGVLPIYEGSPLGVLLERVSEECRCPRCLIARKMEVMDPHERDPEEEIESWEREQDALDNDIAECPGYEDLWTYLRQHGDYPPWEYWDYE